MDRAFIFTVVLIVALMAIGVVRGETSSKRDDRE
jgi:hypothetical protein